MARDHVLMRSARLTVLAVLLVALTSAPRTLSLLYTNDLHVRMDRLAEIERMIAEVRHEGGTVLLLDAGDAWHDYRRPVYGVWGDSTMVAWMNKMGYAAMALGNHETYLGDARLSRLLAGVEFPVLSANWRPANPDHPLQASILLTLADARILVVGVITAEFLPVFAYPSYRYRCPAEAIRAEMVRNDGLYDWLLVVGHMSIEEARVVVRHVPQVDLFITGHSHEQTREVVREGTTLLVQAGAFGGVVGRLDLAFDPNPGSVHLVSNSLLPVEPGTADLREGRRRLLAVTSALLLAVWLWAS